MVDFINIRVQDLLVAEKWLKLLCLDFNNKFSKSTGEITTNKNTAEYKGLLFIITYKSNLQKEIVRLEIKGSLHVYFNNGKHNATDFTFIDLLSVINDLKNKFFVNPKTATIHTLEIGVNLYLTITANALLLNLVAYSSKLFETITDTRKQIGKQICAYQWRLKIYDKGKQTYIKGFKDFKNTLNLVRFEMHFNKMELLTSKKSKGKYNIKTLSDLLDLDKLQPLINEILKKWQDVIYWDKSINLEDLTENKKDKIQDSATPRNWKEYTPKQRSTNRKQFNKLMHLYGSHSQQDIYNMIAEKWQELTAQNRVYFDQLLKENDSTKKCGNGHILTTSLGSQNIPKTYPQKNIIEFKKKAQKSTKKNTVCKVCKTDITHKKASSKFCLKKCNNKYHGTMRTKKRQLQKQTEIKNIEKLKLLIDKGKMWLMISYKNDNSIYTDTLHQKEICTTSEWVRTVQKVLVTEYRKNGKPIILNSYQARRLVKLINNKNLRNEYNEPNRKKI